MSPFDAVAPGSDCPGDGSDGAEDPNACIESASGLPIIGEVTAKSYPIIGTVNVYMQQMESETGAQFLWIPSSRYWTSVYWFVSTFLTCPSTIRDATEAAIGMAELIAQDAAKYSANVVSAATKQESAAALQPEAILAFFGEVFAGVTATDAVLAILGAWGGFSLLKDLADCISESTGGD
jgi:hypothetical protein